MRVIAVAAALALPTPSAGPVDAAESVPPSLRAGGACFEQARVFGNMVPVRGDSERLRLATEVRNRGIAQCLAGQARQGVDTIRRAIEILRG